MAPMSRSRRLSLSVVVLTLASTVAAPSAGAASLGGVAFTELALPGTAMSNYRRAPSPEHAVRVANRLRPSVKFSDFAAEPVFSHGIPGVVMLDYDNDGDLDFYVTNGPGRANSLYQNQLRQTGSVSFVDLAPWTGTALTDQDSNGACAGDIDNNGYTDLYVLGRNAGNRLLLNRGNGTFGDVTGAAGDAAAGTSSHASCTMGDIDGDSLLDIAVANAFDMKNALAIFAVPYAYNQANQLLRNVDGLRFADVSAASGFAHVEVRDVPPGDTGPFNDITWAIAAVDYDQDGDVDLMTGSDQAAYRIAKHGGHDRGFIRLWKNDGDGYFDEVTFDVGLGEPGQWMGLSFADFNADGNLDVFGSSGGDYMAVPLPQMPRQLGDSSSRWFLQRPNGTFADPRRSSLYLPAVNGADPDLGGLNATPWGWSASAFDYDNDGSTDVLYHGALDGMGNVTADNAGALLRNKGPQVGAGAFYPSFDYDDVFARGTTNHRRRTVIGMATGDLDQNGFVDVVSVAQSLKVGQLVKVNDVVPFDFRSPFDRDAAIIQIFRPTAEDPSTLVPTGSTTVEGDLSVEVSSGGNGNRSATVRAVGSVGLAPGARVNRDGVGAVVKFTPTDGPSALRPVVGGAGFASQDAFEGTFGMGRASAAVVEVLWPGGVRNRLYNVRAGERITIPEIPCSFTTTSMTGAQYRTCVDNAVNALVAAGRIAAGDTSRFVNSARRAYTESH
ncbi:CRTAC1 family protein [Actinosynnema sp. NPDC051121]|nr:CRTAC1 family protein [Saccharothrix sp.]